MAQSQKGTPSPSDPKEKKSFFADEEIGKEFLSSWKSISVTEDVSMDFGFDTVSTGKKQSFNFDKLDMDFNLDGDFEKLSSFKVDMPDLDFSSPSKKGAKSKERAGGETSKVNCREKKDTFSFSFDFNELDSFNFDSNLTEAKKTSTKDQDSKGVGSDGRGNQNSEFTEAKKTSTEDPDSKGVGSDGRGNQNSEFNLTAGANSLEGAQAEKLPASERETSSMVSAGASDSGNESLLHGQFSSNSGTSGELVVFHGERNFPENTVTDKADEARPLTHFSEKAKPTESFIAQSMQVLPVQSFSGNDSTKDVASDVGTQSGSLETKVNIELGAGRSVDDRLIPGTGYNHESSEPKKCVQQSQLHVTGSGSIRGESENIDSKIPTERMMETELLSDDLDLEATSVENLPQAILKDSQVNRETENSALQPLAPVRSASVADKAAPVEENESGVVCSKSFKRSDGDKPQLCQPSPIGEDVSSSGNKGVISVHLVHPDNGKRALIKGQPGSDSNGDESEKMDCEIPTDRMVEPEPQKDDLDIEATSAETLPQTTPHVSKVKKDTPSSALKPVSPSRSAIVADKVAQTKEKEPGVVCSKFFKRSEVPIPNLCEPSSNGAEVLSSGSKGIALLHLVHPDNGKGEDFIAMNAQKGEILDVYSKSLSKGLAKGQPAFLGGEKNVKNLFNLGKRANVESVQDGCRQSVTPRPCDKEVTKGDHALVGSKMHIKGLNNFGSEVTPASSRDKTTKSIARANVTSTSMGSIWNKKLTSVKGVKAGKLPDVSSLKISRDFGASKDQSIALIQGESHSLRNLEKTMQKQGNILSNVHSVASTERKTSPVTLLKRKASEEFNVDLRSLNHHKRISPSPSENSLLKTQESMVEEQVCNYDIPAHSKTTNILCDNPNSGSEMAREVNFKELHIHLETENDGIMEKAEAYAKELEEICNMLKKKNEEAKETLVRAIVNNNYLLILNHPMFDEKIRMVERFAAQLRLD